MSSVPAPLFGTAKKRAPSPAPARQRHPVLQDIDGFGRDIIARSASVNDGLLEMTKSSSLQELGGMLTEIIVISKQLDPKDLKEGNFVSRLWSNAKLKKEKFFAKHRSVKEQISKVVGEVQAQAKKMDDQIRTLDAMYETNERDFETFGTLMEQCKVALGELQEELAEMVGEESGGEFQAQKISDKRSEINRLEKKIVNLELSRTIAFQTAPQIRMMQESARQMIGTFRDVIDVTIPAWEKQFSLQILLIEQQTAIEVANAVHDTTNEIVRKNAEMLRKNAGAVARVANRQVVEIETLEYAQNELIGAISDVSNVVKEAVQKRGQTMQRTGQLRDELVAKLKN